MDAVVKIALDEVFQRKTSGLKSARTLILSAPS
jgi:hypothetical protein